MTWHKVMFPLKTDKWIRRKEIDQWWLAMKWCTDNLSSEGVLWKSDLFSCFYFAQTEDLVLFRLTMGV